MSMHPLCKVTRRQAPRWPAPRMATRGTDVSPHPGAASPGSV